MVKTHRLLALLFVCFGAASYAWVGPNQRRAAVRTIQGEGFELSVFDNSETISQVLDLNDKGHVLGQREVANETGTIFSQEFFFSDGRQTFEIPLLEDYTAIHMEAISDNDRLVGYASRPMGHPEGSLTAVVWDGSTQKLTKLDGLPGDLVCHAQSISSDGELIAGYSTGSRPARIRPCVWRWDPAVERWIPEALPVLFFNNPFVTSSRVVISPDGKRVATSATKEILDDGPIDVFDNSVFVWEHVGEDWQRREVTPEAIRLKAINNNGEMVGEFTREGLRFPCYLSSDGELTEIGLLPGDVSGEAKGINDDGVVVGFSDDPPGPEGGPQAFAWRGGEIRALEMPEGNTFSAALAINDQGQIAGYADVMLPVTSDPKDSDVTTAEPSDTVVKTLGFIWTKKPLGGDSRSSD